MASMSMVEQLEEQPPAKKPRIDNPKEEKEIANANESNLPKSTGMIEHKELETSTTTTVDLPRGHRKLPAELNSQIFLCLTPAAQRKFIWGLNWDFYAMFRHRLLTKTKRVRNPRGIRWNNTNTRATIAADGLSVSNRNHVVNSKVFAVQPFPISGPHCRVDDFPGTILYYYEVKGHLLMSSVGLSGGAIRDNSWVGRNSNSYAILIDGHHFYGYCLAGETRLFELPDPEMKENGNVYGCGLVLDPNNNLAIFSTLNSQLLGRKIPISPTVDRLFPAVTMAPSVSFEVNFGDDLAIPFEYDIQNCSGLELACI